MFISYYRENERSKLGGRPQGSNSLFSSRLKKDEDPGKENVTLKNYDET